MIAAKMPIYYASGKAIRVNLIKRLKTYTGLRYCPVVMSRNGRVKSRNDQLRPDYVAVDGAEEP